MPLYKFCPRYRHESLLDGRIDSPFESFETLAKNGTKVPNASGTEGKSFSFILSDSKLGDFLPSKLRRKNRALRGDENFSVTEAETR